MELTRLVLKERGPVQYVNRYIDKNPGAVSMWPRRWLLYFTLFLSGLVAIIDLIILIYQFLQGTGTESTFMKVFLVLGASVIIFVYYVLDLKNNGIASGVRLVTGLVVVLATIGTILLGIGISGSPATLKKMKDDQQKISNIQSVSYNVQSYWRTNKRLPASIDDLKNGSLGVDKSFLPEYKPDNSTASSSSYRLCADFNYSSDYSPSVIGNNKTNQYSYYGMDKKWEHSAGNKCFDLSAETN